jgi:hypothetical protein
MAYKEGKIGAWHVWITAMILLIDEKSIKIGK